MASHRLRSRMVAIALGVGLMFTASSLQAQHHGGHSGSGHMGGSHHSGMGGGGHHHHHHSSFGGYGGFGNSGLSIGLGYGGLGYGGYGGLGYSGYGSSYGLGRSYYSSRPAISSYASPSYSYPVPQLSYSSRATAPSVTYSQGSTYSSQSNPEPSSDLRPGMVLPDGSIVVSVEPIK